jgi:hypothetical protein
MNTGDRFENCIQIERILGQIYGVFMLSDESTNRFFKSTMNNDNDHVDALKKAFEKLL